MFFYYFSSVRIYFISGIIYFMTGGLSFFLDYCIRWWKSIWLLWIYSSIIVICLWIMLLHGFLFYFVIIWYGVIEHYNVFVLTYTSSCVKKKKRKIFWIKWLPWFYCLMKIGSRRRRIFFLPSLFYRFLIILTSEPIIFLLSETF